MPLPINLRILPGVFFAPSDAVIASPVRDRFARFSRIKDSLVAHLQTMNRPDVVNLSQVVESNSFHNTDVLTHSLAVAEAGRNDLELAFIANPSVKERFMAFLAGVVDPASTHQYTRSELLYAVMFVHDVGKGMNDPKTGQPILQIKDGKTTAFKHAGVGAPVAEEIAKEVLGCSDAEASFVRNIVAHHMDGFNLNSNLSGKNAADPEVLIGKFLADIGYNPAIILHTMADIEGSIHEEGFGALYCQLIERLFVIKRGELNSVCSPETSEKALQVVESLAKKYGVILVPGHDNDSIALWLANLLQVEYSRRGSKVEGDLKTVIDSRVKKILPKFQGVPSAPTADAVAEGFDCNRDLSRNPVILTLVTEPPRPEISTIAK